MNQVPETKERRTRRRGDWQTALRGVGVSAAAILAALVVVACSSGESPPFGPPSTDPPDQEPPPPPVLPGSWTVGVALPEPIQEFHGAVLNGRIYVAGGIGQGNATSNRTYRFDPAANAWERVADLPGRRHHMPLVVVGGNLYAVGGFGPDGFEAERDLWRYEEAEDRWIARPGPVHARGASAAVPLNGRLYLFGGFGVGQLHMHEVEVYDPATNSWGGAAPLPELLDHLAAVVVGGRIYAIGGRRHSAFSNTGAVHVYDPVADAWTQGPSLPEPTAGHAAAVLNGRIHVFGGEGAVSVARRQDIPALLVTYR